MVIAYRIQGSETTLWKLKVTRPVSLTQVSTSLVSLGWCRGDPQIQGCEDENDENHTQNEEAIAGPATRKNGRDSAFTSPQEARHTGIPVQGDGQSCHCAAKTNKDPGDPTKQRGSLLSLPEVTLAWKMSFYPERIRCLKGKI